MLQNNMGGVLMAATTPEPHYNDPLEVELLAIFRGLQLCILMGLQTLIVESDSQLAIQAIREGETALVQHATLIREIRALSTSFLDCNFQYVNCMGNQGAHTFARHAWRIHEFLLCMVAGT